MNGDTIAAVASPPGQGAIAVVRMSGRYAFRIAAQIFSARSRFKEIPARVATFGRIIDQGGDSIDEVLLIKFQGPNSYTGENLVEITCHGGMLVTQSILERLFQSGARSAEGGEFTQRAFLNGKMDLTQAEAVMDVISAQTRLALRAANEQISGRLGEQIEHLRKELIAITAHLEAFIDFPDEDIDPDTGSELVERIEDANKRVSELCDTAEQGRILREGVRTVIAGAPNVGKSSLLNLLLGFDRAIVSETAGTTRDTIEEVINLGGIPLRLIDTAGVRAAGDAVEQEGISRAEAQIANAELVLEVFDGNQPRAEVINLEKPESAHHLIVINKSDLGVDSDWEGADGILISCTAQTGIEKLTERIREILMGDEAHWGDHSVAINARHKACLERTSGFLKAAAELLQQGQSPEFVAVELRSALDGVGEVTGKTDIEEILGEIFGTFCIGK